VLGYEDQIDLGLFPLSRLLAFRGQLREGIWVFWVGEEES